MSHTLTFISLLLICLTFPLSLCWVVKVVQEYERAVVFRLGRMLTGKARGPGVFFIIPCIDVYEKIDLRTQTYDVPPQEVPLSPLTSHSSVSPFQILTKDSVTVYVNAIMYYKVYDSNMAVSAVDDYNTSTRSLAAAALRNILGTRNLGEILSERYLFHRYRHHNSIAYLLQRLHCYGDEAHPGRCYVSLGSPGGEGGGEGRQGSRAAPASHGC